MKIHDGQRSRDDGERGAAVLDRMFSADHLVVPATPHHDRKQGADRFLIKRQDGRVILTVDYKTDWKAGTRPNRSAVHAATITLKISARESS